MFAKEYALKYPESYDQNIPEDLVYSGKYKVTDAIKGVPVNVGKLVLSPTRTYAPIMIEVLKELQPKIHGIVHCSGGAQTKVLHFIDNVHVIKDQLFDIPPLFQLIYEQSATSWEEMYRVFNMGHRMEVYLPEPLAQRVIEISKSFKVDAKVVGRVESATKAQVSIQSKEGTFVYLK